MEGGSQMRKNQIVPLCANEIYNEISNHWAWPLATPHLDRTIEKALKGVGQLLNMNYRAPLRCKLLPCCSILLCYKKKTSNNVFAIINDGIDQRELDMMQAERVEQVRIENEARARRMAGPEEVLEMRDTLYSEAPLGGGVGGAWRSSAQSYLSRDPVGQRYNDVATVATEASDSSSVLRDPRAQGGYASHLLQRGGSRGGMVSETKVSHAIT